MTQEQKARAYDEALERAKEIKEKIMYSHLSTESCKAVSEYIDTIIPELAESEDERIRRTLVEYFGPKVQLDFVRGVPIQKIRDWLEKQKEPDYLNKFTKLPHLNSDYEVVDDWAYTPSLCHCDGNWAVCWIHCEDGDVLHECIGDTPEEAIDKAVEWFTSLGKQIPVKKVGAIISSRDKEETACGYLERCLTPDMRRVWYEACDELKKACFQEAEKQKEQKHPDGCFTCDEYKKGYEAGRLNGFTAGYNKAMKEQKLDSLTKYVYSKDDKKFIQDCANILVANDYSATAERLLSMFEQKPVDYEAELKKCKDNPLYFFDKYVSIKQKPANDKAFEEWIDDWWKHNKVNNPDSYDNGDEIQFDEKNFKNFCRGIKNMYQQKPAEWSEEDKSFYDSIMCEVIKEGMHPTPEQVKWFKSLPERFNLQPKQEWSEEDERMRNQLIYDVECHKKEGLISAKQNKATKTLYDGIEKCYDEKIAWLKSFCPQSHWKPSKEQMKALNALNLYGSISYVGQQNQLISLSQDLEKL